ncbi:MULTISPECIES: DUF192 domain-containing protein [Halomonadaceae]|uniref:DUF192 domain-containing protein n=1 Tax=Halomonadaceae TaxID=28256 RepID=UPI0015837D7F|nr:MULTISPECIES: DUF192 domain-containing protein [Halomonas]MDI4638118.1 DUF192 domain-containing protein [Halomonas sp. BMC7]NUJ59120.1 DUF192 domain-containing protein [Halomonas taeanensis]
MKTPLSLSRRRVLSGLAAVGSVAGAIAWLPLAAWPASTARAAKLHFASATLAIHGDQGPSRLEVELAESPQQRSTGLMEREQLGAEAGMLFVYQRPQSPDSGFWMYRTLIPLDIAFIDRNGRIAAIRQMTPCGSDVSADCRAYRAGVAYIAALEVNAGYFAARGIEVGDCVSLPGSVAPQRGQCAP